MMKFTRPIFVLMTSFLCLTGEENSKKLVISLYYESLCPDCINFDRNQLYPVYTKLVDYLDLDLIPYGNAQTTQNSNGSITIKCQHGEEECRGNKLHACAISKLNPQTAANFVGCTMSQKKPQNAGLFCARQLNITKPYRSIAKCQAGPEGLELLNKNGIRTNNLKPPHTFVPWVIFNGAFNEQDMNDSMTDLLSVVCRLLTGNLPSICNQV